MVIAVIEVAAAAVVVVVVVVVLVVVVPLVSFTNHTTMLAAIDHPSLAPRSLH